MRVLFSIKPEFAKLIFDGTKKFEFRKTIFKNKNIKTVVVYASSPLQKVVGEFEIEDIINEDLDLLWEKTKEHAGIDRAYFNQYFAAKNEGYAIKIKTVTEYENYQSLKDDYNLTPPQSFLYL